MVKIIGVDTCIFAYVFSENPEFFEISKKILEEIEKGKTIGVFSAIGMIELLTGPKRLGDFKLAEQYKILLSHFPNLKIINLTEAIIDRASDLRARYQLRTPDSIHLATAIESGAKQFFTNDKALKKVKEIEVLCME